jgi:hypothetical protein
MDRSDLDFAVQEAIELFERSEVGQQLRDPMECHGRCRRASQRFLSALAAKDRKGQLLEWAWDGAWHHAVQLDGTDIVIDWTAAQFEDDVDAARGLPFPRIETRSQAEERWGEPAVIDMESKADRYFHNVPPLMPWDVAQRRIPARGSEQERLNRH